MKPGWVWFSHTCCWPDTARTARAACAHEGHRDPVAGLPLAHAGSDGLDDAGELVPGHVRQVHVRVMAHPAVPVAAAHAGRLDADDGSVGVGHGHGDVTRPAVVPRTR